MNLQELQTLRRCALFVCMLAIPCARPAFGQSGGTTPPTDSSPAGVPAPTASEAVRTRDAAGKITIRATRITTPIKIDGHLDEAPYKEVSPITDFFQQEPQHGMPISEKTDAWLFFDDDNIYVACRCWDTHPERIVANEMRRDSNNLVQQDNFGVAFDTFHDGRSGVFLFMTAIGAMRDAVIIDLTFNIDWNPIYDGKTSRSEQGWIAEFAIPFKSLRYGPGEQQTWGIQMRRTVSYKNEEAFLTPVNLQWGSTSLRHIDSYATLVGLSVPASSRNLDIKPYGISRLTSDLVRTPPVSNNIALDTGVDVKYGVTKGLTADFTYNTDFAQVEVDEAQVNLTRFSLSFPEKREFFLEGQGLFQFGVGGPSIVNSARGEAVGSDAPAVFYSRRIGLNSSRLVPIVGGARLTGKAGPWSVGALNITTDDDAASQTPQTTFSVLRLRRDVLRRGTFGGIFSRRSVSTIAPGDNKLWGVDSSLTFFENVYVDASLAQSQTEGRRGDDVSYRGQFAYIADRLGLVFDRLVVEKNFNPEVGFLRRENFRRNLVQARISSRTTNNPLIRRLNYQASLEYTTDNDNRLESRELQGLLGIEFHNADRFSVQHSRLHEFVPALFLISTGVRLPIGGYTFENTIVSYTAGQQHRISGASLFEIGGFYNGEKKTATFRGRAEVTSQFSVEPNISLNWIDLPQARFTNTVVGGRGTYSFTPRSFVAGLVQYSSSTASFSTNLRLRWEYKPGSEMFIVYTDERATVPSHWLPLRNRGFVVKVNRLFRF